ncbi:TPA: hypothetical protein EYP70_04795 [Candidatus Bathyarchaeota archaeon]|nr:hypothetical protein [Candidatus Bathyarchaeota archaeon]
MIGMERFLPILETIYIRLREILIRNERYIVRWEVSKIKRIGEDLINLAWDVSPQLIEVEHRILCSSIKEAGLGIWNRASKVDRDNITKEDKEYFRSVHEALGNLCEKMGTGEYYEALLEVASKIRDKKRL